MSGIAAKRAPEGACVILGGRGFCRAVFAGGSPGCSPSVRSDGTFRDGEALSEPCLPEAHQEVRPPCIARGDLAQTSGSPPSPAERETGHPEE